MKILKYIAYTAGAFLLLVLTVLALLPATLSCPFGKNFIQKIVNKTYPGTITFDSLSLGWFEGFKLTNLSIKDEKARPIASVALITLDKPLIKFLYAPLDIGNLNIEHPKVFLYQDDQLDKETLIHSHKSKISTEKEELTPTSTSSMKIVPLSGKVSIIEASCEIYKDGLCQGGLQNASCSMTANLPKQVDISVDALLVGNNCKAPLHAQAKAGESNQKTMSGTASISCQSIPTDLIGLFVKNLDKKLPEALKELLGSSFSIQCNAELKEDLYCTTTIKSKNLNSDISFFLKENIFTLKEGTLLSATCTPSLLNVLSQHLPPHIKIDLLKEASCVIQNKKPLVIDCNKQRLISPVLLSLSSPSQINLLVGEDKQPFTLSLESSLQSDDSTANLLTDFSATSGSLTGLFQTKTDFSFSDKQIHLNSSIACTGEWPSLIEKITHLPAKTLIGPSLDYKLNCKGLFENANLFSFSVESLFASAQIQNSALFSLTQESIDLSNFSLSGCFSQDLCSLLSIPIKLQNPTESIKISSTLSNCHIPISEGLCKLTESTLDCTSNLFIPAATFFNEEILAQPSKASFCLKKEATDPLTRFKISSLFPIQYPKIPAVKILLSDPGINLSTNGTIDLITQKISLDNLKIISEGLQVSVPRIETQLSSPLFVHLINPIKTSLICSNELLASLCKTDKNLLLTPITLSCIVEPIDLLIEKDRLSLSPLQGLLTSDLIKTVQLKGIEGFLLQAPFSFNPNEKKALFQASIFQKTDKLVEGTITFDISAENPKIHSTFALNNLPVELLDLIAQQKLSDLIGRSLNTNIDCLFTGITEPGNYVQITANGDFWKTSMDLSVDTLTFHLTQPFTFEASVTPDRLKTLTNFLKSPDTISLTHEAKLNLCISECNANISSLLEQSSYFSTLDSASLQATASIIPLKLETQSKELFSIDRLDAQINLCGSKRSLSFAITSPKNQTPNLNVEGSITDAWDKFGLRINDLNIGSHLQIANFPTKTLEIVSPGKGPLLAETLGSSLNCNMQIDVTKMTTGTVSFDCSAKNASAHVDAIIEKGVLRLKNPAKASLAITKQAGELLFKNIAPFLSSAARSEKPLEVIIPTEGVSIPIRPFSEKTMRIPNITAKLGKIIVKNGDVLKVILGVLGQQKSATNEEVNLWLTPIYASVENGLIICKRTDILVADSIHMIYWGDVNLNNRTLDMTVAIPDETLLKLHLIPVSLDSGKGIQIPITGSMDNPKVETKAALARLASAGVTTYIKDPQVQIIGALFQAAASAIDSGKPIPPPTTTPLPWETKS